MGGCPLRCAHSAGRPCRSATAHWEACRWARRCFGLARLPRLRFLRSRLWVQSSQPMRLCGRCPRSVTDAMVALVLPPSLSPSHHDQSSCRRAGACVLQALPQSSIMVRFRPCLLATEERDVVLRICGYRQRAVPHIHANDTLMGRVCLNSTAPGSCTPAAPPPPGPSAAAQSAPPTSARLLVRMTCVVRIASSIAVARPWLGRGSAVAEAQLVLLEEHPPPPLVDNGAAADVMRYYDCQSP